MPSVMGQRQSTVGRSSAATNNNNDPKTMLLAHELIQAEKDLGEATALLPLVSTLTFGFAVSRLLASTSGQSEVRPAVLLMLTVSACCDLWVISFSVLESYYTKMVAYYEDIAMKQCALLNQSLDATRSRALATRMARAVETIKWMRDMARNLIWVSLILLTFACATQIALEHGARWFSIVIVALVMLAAFSVPLTVMHFRRTFRPIIEAYNEESAPLVQPDLEGASREQAQLGGPVQC